MSLLKVNNISGSSTSITFEDNVTFSKAVNITSGAITASFAIANASIEKEKLTNDARDWVNILNKPAGLITSSTQFATSISGSSLALADITSSGTIKTTGVFSGSGAQLFGLPNAALNNSSITINGSSVSLGGTRTLTTTDISEGTNQYYTDARVKAKLNTETVVSSSGQINYQSITGQPTVNTLGGDGNQSFTITTGIFVTASGGADGIVVTNDTANYTLRLRTVGGTVSSSAQVVAALPAGIVSSSTQVPAILPTDTVSSSAQVKAFLPGGTVSSSVQTVANLVGQNVATAQITASGHIIPSATDTYDLGSPTARFKDLYLSGSTLYLGTLALKDTNGTLVVTTSGSSTPSPASGSFTGSFTGSFAGTHTGTFPYASLTGTPNGIVSSSAQYPGWVTASSQIDYNSITNKLSGVVSSSTQVQPLLPAGTVSSSGQVTVQNTTGIGAIATTGSNIFVGNQTISGSTTITGNLTVQGTSSILYVTSSQLDVGSNKLTLNTTAILRYGGLNVYDSGSVTNQSGSLLWDSINNVWLFVHAGTSNTSSIVITGPENTGALGNEQFLTQNLLPKAGTSGDHIVNSQISDNGTQVGIVGSLKVTGSITASAVSGALTGTFPYASLTGIPSAIVSSSTQVATLLPAGTVSSSGQITYSSISGISAGIVSSSTQVQPLLPAGTVSSSAQVVAGVAGQTIAPTIVNATTITATSVTASVSGALTGTFPYNSLTSIPSGIVSSSGQVAPLLPAGTVSSSGQINAGATANFATAVAAQLSTVHSGSYLGTATTNNLAEGVTNLYYTDARVKTKLDAEVVHSGSFLGTATTDNLTQGSTNKYYANSLVLNYINSLSVLSSSQQVVDRLPTGTVSSSTQIATVLVNSASYAATASLALGVSGSLAVNTDGLNEGSINLYYTDARVKTKLNVENVHSASFLGTATTTNLTEGINLYFTNARAIAALPGVISSSTQLPVLLPGGVVSSSAQYPGWVTSSAQINTGSFSGSFVGTFTGSILANNGIVSGASQVVSLLPGGTVSSSAQYPGWVTSSAQAAGWTVLSASFATTASYISGNVQFNNGLDITGSLLVIGAVSASSLTGSILSPGVVSASSQYPGWVTASSQVDYNSITNKLSGVYSSSTQAVAAIAAQTIAPTTVNATSILSGSVLQTGTNALIGGKLAVTGSAEFTGTITASNLSANQAVFTNANDGLVSNAITGTGNVVMSASPTLTGTLTAASITANGTLLLQNIVSQSSAPTFTGLTSTGTVLLAGIYSSSAQTDITTTTGYSTFSSSLATVDAGQTTRIDNLASLTSSYAINSTIQSQLAGVISSSAQTVSALSGQRINISGSQFTGIVSGSGTEYRLVVPVGTNQYAT